MDYKAEASNLLFWMADHINVWRDPAIYVLLIACLGLLWLAVVNAAES